MFTRFLIISLICSTTYASSTLLLIRHGETEWNVEGRVQGHADTPLNATGQSQASTIAEKLAGQHPDIAAIYSSDLSRAYSTAEKTAEKLHLPITKRESLREICYGVTEGIPFAEKYALYGAAEKEIEERYATRHERWDHTVIPGAETLNHLLHRLQSELVAIAATHPGRKVAIFTHGRAIRTLLEELQDTEGLKPLPNGAIVHLRYSDALEFLCVE